MKRQRPTIFDLERITGFSTGTISRAFNQSTRINAATRELILQKAKEIGYAPHSGARALIQGRSRRWGLLLPHLHNPRYAELMDHLDLEARRRSTLLLLGLSRYDAAAEAELALHWASGEADGIIADACIDAAVFEQLRRRKFPIVFLFGAPSSQFDAVTSDTSACCDKLFERCIQLGHRRIGYVGQTHPHCRMHHSYTSYIHMLKAHGMPLDESLVFFGTRDYVAGMEAWAHWRHASRRPTAVLCFNDIIACGLIQSCQADGCRVPEDLSVIGNDDISVAALYNLTTMRTEPAEIAAYAFALLERPHTRGAEQRTVHGSIVERGSIGPVPKEHKVVPTAGGKRKVPGPSAPPVSPAPLVA